MPSRPPFEDAPFYSARQDTTHLTDTTPTEALCDICDKVPVANNIREWVVAHAPIAIYPYYRAPIAYDDLDREAADLLESLDETWGETYAAEGERLWTGERETVARGILREVLRALRSCMEVTALVPGAPRLYSAEEVLVMLPPEWLAERDDSPHGAQGQDQAE